MTKTIFDINEAQMSETKSTYTLTEIYQQPATWKKTCQQITELKDEFLFLLKMLCGSTGVKKRYVVLSIHLHRCRPTLHIYKEKDRAYIPIHILT